MPTNDWEQLQSVYRRIQNRIVREDFREDILDDDISTPEGALKYACLLKDNDTADMTLLRLWLFYIVREQAKRFHPNLYTFPVEDYQRSVVFKPQLILEFHELSGEARINNRKPIYRRASYRLVNETTESITQSKINTLGNRIRTQFPKTYRYKTGRYKMSYRDKKNGLELVATPYSETEGKEFIKRVLNVAAVTPDWDRLSISKNPSRNFNAIETVSILGKSQKGPQYRPIANTYFRRAILHIHGLTESIIVDERYPQ